MRKQLWKLWGVLLWICVLSAHTMATATETADDSQKDSPAFELSVLSVQKMEESYDSDSSDIRSARSGDTLIVTVGFRNNGEESVKLTGSAFFLEYDERYLEPEDENFERNDDLNWSMTVIRPENFHVLAATGFGDAYETAAGESIFLNRFAFRVREDAEEGETALNLVSFQGYDSGLLDDNNDSVPLEISGHALSIRKTNLPDTPANYAAISLQVNGASHGTAYIASVLRDGVQVAPDDVQPGDRVTIACQPDSGYAVSIRVRDANKRTVSVTKIDSDSSWFDMPSAMPVTVRVTYSRNSSGGGGSGSSGGAPNSSGGSITQSPKVQYSIQIDSSPNGTIKSSPLSASKGERVTITVTPHKGYALEEAIVSADNSGSNWKVTSRDERFTFTMPASGVTVSAKFRTTEYGGIPLLLDPVVSPDKSPFFDVDTGSPLYKDIIWASSNLLMVGYTDGSYRPQTKVPSGTIIIVFARMENPRLRTSRSETDYEIYEEWSATHHVPMEDTPFSRGEMAKLLASYLWSRRPNYAPSHVVEFSDPDSAWEDGEKEAFQVLVGAGIVDGTGNRTMDPRGYVTRAQLAAFIHRLYRFLAISPR